MNIDQLRIAQASEAFRSEVEATYSDHYASAAIMARVPMTPDGHFGSEVHDRVIYATTEDASWADRATGAFMGSIFLGMVLAIPFSFLSTLVFGSTGWALIPGFLTGLLGVPFLASKIISRIFSRPSQSVSMPMVTAWNSARRVFENANEENTVPAILEKLHLLRVEMDLIGSTYSDLISEVEKEQAEADFVFAASMVEALAGIAKTTRVEVYSSNRLRYMLAVV